MRDCFRYLATSLMVGLTTLACYGQSVTISGTVSNSASKETLSSVTISIKGANAVGFSNPDGSFSIKVSKIPVTLVFTSAGGYDPTEVTVTDASKPIEVGLNVNTLPGQEVVLAASRVPQRILESPVTVERMSNNVLKNVPAPNPYEAMANLKGVDVHTASLTFRTITTRGFVGSGNIHLNQLIDGMDNQAPGLNFSVGSVVGLTELDYDNIELLSGASSALYGSGGENGTVLITSKNPFKYQGFSFNVKQGVMHIDQKQQSNVGPFNDWSFRYAKAYKNKFAFKLAAELIRGNDWQAQDYRNKEQIGILSKVVGGNRTNDPNYNGINVYGDETSADMAGFSFFVQDQTNRSILGATGGLLDVVSLLNTYYHAIGDPKYPTNQQRDGFFTFPFFPPQVLAILNNPAIAGPIGNMFPFYNGLKNGYYNGASVSRTGYLEKDLVDYNTLDVKLTGGLYWNITPKVEASYNVYFGTGTTVYTGADRYSLRNLKIAQHKLEFKARNWFLRAYTTQENAGDSYNTSALGAFLNEYSSPSSIWFPTYIGTFEETRRLAGPTISDLNIHLNARTAADVNHFLPGTPQFEAASKTIKSTPIRQNGALFLDRSDLYAAEGQLNISDAAGFSDKIEMIIGVSWKQWVMNSQGTIFADTLGVIKIQETGAYLQLQKKLFDGGLTLTASGRYDKQTNFKGKFTPRITGVIRVSKDNFIRLSYQTAYRFPTNQNQYISLVTGSGVLMGCLPEFQDYYKLSSSLPGYTAASVVDYRKPGGSIADSGVLVRAVYKPVTPEIENSFEIGYKGLIQKSLLVDAYVYFSRYKDFLINDAVVQSRAGNQYEVYSPFSSTNVSYIQNSDQIIKTVGWGIGLEYLLPHKFVAYGNVYMDKLKDVPANEVTFFNAPKYRFNIGLRNENVYHNVGFNVVVKWQDNNYYEGTFVTGTLPYFAWVDGQVSYRPPNTKSVFRIGGTNLGNNYYRTGFGSPAVGGLYYISYGYNIQ